jgi:hypothetical protein
MKKWYILAWMLLSLKGFGATVFWDGGGGDGLWATAANWVGDVVPTPADDVVLDNSLLATTYTVNLPNTAVTVQSLTLTPGTGNNITLVLPVGNTAEPGFSTTNDLVINNGGTFKNASGASSAPTITIGNATNDSIYIRNGGTYEHNTVRSSTLILDKISTAVGTEYGLVHFNMPLTTPASISMQGRIFGSLEFSAGSAPTALTYSSSGNSSGPEIPPILVRGNFKVNSPANFTSSVIGGFIFYGNVTGTGNITYNPTASANLGKRSLFFSGSGNTQVIGSTGNFTLGSAFVKMEVSSGATVSLQRSITTFGAGDSVLVEPNATLILTGENALSGTGSIFYNDTLSTLQIASASGITASAAAGHVQTGTRNFSKKAYYHYNGTLAQATGDGLPDSVYRLFVQNPADVTLSSQLCVLQRLALDSGRLFTTTVNRIKLAVGGLVTSVGNNQYGNANEGNQSSFVSGPIIMETNTTDTLTFPIGKKSGADIYYAPVKLKPGNTTQKEYRAEYFPATHVDAANVDGSLDRVSSVEYWDISSNVVSVPDVEAKVSLSWRPNSAVGTGNAADSAQAMQDLVVAHYFNDGFSTRWRMDGGGASTFTVRPNSTLSYGFITTDLPTGSFSPFTLGTRSPFNVLPLTLVNFTGTAVGDAVQLRWTVRSERQVRHYEVEKSTDGQHFVTISTVAAVNTTALYRYGAVDGHVTGGWVYYRLKVIDNQQHRYYTNTVKVWVGEVVTRAYPNPANDFLKIFLPSSSNCDIRFVNMAGQVVKRVTAAQGPVTVDVKSLDKGMYYMYIYIPTNRQAIVQRFTKQ